MKITTNINRYDLIWLNVYLQLRGIFTYALFGFLSTIFYYKWYAVYIDNCNENTALGILLSTLLGIVAVLLCCSLFLATTVYIVGKSPGVLCLHEYTLASEGLFQKTSVDECILKWQGIRKVHVSKKYLLIWINHWQCHMVPRRSFKSQEDFNVFTHVALNYWRNAQKNNEASA